MTCIVGYTDKKGQSWIGGDSAGVAGLNIRERKDPKVFYNGKFTIGYTSSFRMGQLLRFKWIPPTDQNDSSDYQFMCTKVIDSIRKCLKDNGYAKVHNNEETIGKFIIAYKNKIYEISCDLQVEETYDNYTSVGCGQNYALGALKILNYSLSAERVIEEALETAVKFSGGVRPPFTILKTK